MIEEVKRLINKYDKITILTHLKSDADTIGTALGIYGLLKKSGKQVEVVNQGRKIPIYLDFLPHFSKIKSQIDFEESLIITCDVGSIDLLGFDLAHREILNIDHHKSNTHYGTINVVKPTFVSSSQVAYALLKEEYEMSKEIATCFYTALVADTQYFSTNNMSKGVFNVALELIEYGVNIIEVASNIKQRRSLASLRILSSTLDTLNLYKDGELASMICSRQKMQEAGANIIDTLGIVDYGISLVTVKIAIVLIELEDSIRVSMRSKKVDLSNLAITFGGGGHNSAVGFEIKNISYEVVLEMIKKEINEIGLLNEK